MKQVIALKEAMELKKSVFRSFNVSVEQKKHLIQYFSFSPIRKSDRSSSLEIVKARKGRKCRDGKGRGNDSRSEFLVELAIDLATTTPRSPLAFFVKQVEIDVMLMEFREISANHMLSCAAAAEVGGKAGLSQKY